MRAALSRRSFRRLALVAGFVGIVAVVAMWLWRTAYDDALTQLDRAGRADLALAADRLASELERFRVNAALTARRPEVAGLLAGDSVDIRPLLQELADVTGSLDILVTDRRGAVLAGARASGDPGYQGTPLFERALDGALGLDHLVSDVYGRRVFRFASPVFGADGPVIGAVVAIVDVEAVEAEWRGGRPAVFVTDDRGVVFVTNRSELLLAQRGAGAQLTGAVVTSEHFRGHEIWTIDGGPYLPRRALHVMRPLPAIGMTGEALLDLGPARAMATAQAAAVAAILMALGSILFWALERRRTLARVAADLEARVARRTAELVAVNFDLTREVAERRETELRLSRAQEDLVQAGKLSALGQMSAGISHELNQPLMAIRSFAENAEAYLRADKPDMAGRNLLRISELARRMGRIIKNLRAFSRQESEALGPVDIVQAVDAALEMAAARLRQDEVVCDWQRPSAPIVVRGGEVRLQQVVLNLVSNAADAMDGRTPRALTLSIAREGARVLLSVCDTGPGIAEPEKMFNPFYTTKQVGAGEGMGLGLSISYGLVQSFGGAIRGRNRDEGGAMFIVELESWVAGEVAA